MDVYFMNKEKCISIGVELKQHKVLSNEGEQNKINQTVYQYCVDCQCMTEQTYHHTNIVDGDLVYICDECGCENSCFIE